MSPRWYFVGMIVALLAVAVWFFGRLRPGQAYDLDRDVEEKYLEGRQQVDAVEFFEKGGLYESVEFPNTDKEYVLPTVKRLKEELQLKPIVALEEPGRAFGIFVEVPSDPIIRQKIGAFFQEADDAFPGLLMDHWGQKWVSLDWLEGAELQALKSSQALELIQGEHERVRKNP